MTANPHSGYEAVIGLEIHAELETASKMFCACPVVDSTVAAPNSAVCPICAGMPGVLPVVNQKAVEYGLRVALALECEIEPTSIFARKNYFYPDLPKGYQISQYEQPLARNGRLQFLTESGPQTARIRRVHLEEDTGKLTHRPATGASPAEAEDGFSLVDLNRAGVPLLEIVSEPDLHSAEAVRAYAAALRSLLRYLGVNSGDMQKGVLRIEPNVSVRPAGSAEFGTRTEIKNLNSLRALERSVAYEIDRQTQLIEAGGQVAQQTLGWDEAAGRTLPQRSKEEAHDYRYFPEPDLPPLIVDPDWVAGIRAGLPELPLARQARFQEAYDLNAYDAGVLVAEQDVAEYFEAVVAAAPHAPPKTVANWVSGELFGLLNEAGESITTAAVPPAELGALIEMVVGGEINQTTAKEVLTEMFAQGTPAAKIVAARGLKQISDRDYIAGLAASVLDENPEQTAAYLQGKETLGKWLFGQIMRKAQGRANPQVVQAELERALNARRA